jgi:hypothetical protein
MQVALDMHLGLSAVGVRALAVVPLVGCRFQQVVLQPHPMLAVEIDAPPLIGAYAAECHLTDIQPLLRRRPVGVPGKLASGEGPPPLLTDPRMLRFPMALPAAADQPPAL